MTPRTIWVVLCLFEFVVHCATIHSLCNSNVCDQELRDVFQCMLTGPRAKNYTCSCLGRSLGSWYLKVVATRTEPGLWSTGKSRLMATSVAASWGPTGSKCRFFKSLTDVGARRWTTPRLKSHVSLCIETSLYKCSIWIKCKMSMPICVCYHDWSRKPPFPNLWQTQQRGGADVPPSPVWSIGMADLRKGWEKVTEWGEGGE